MAHQLVRDHVSRNVIAALEQLLEGAKAGHIVGLAFGAALKGRRYLVNSAGTLASDPTFARGVIAALDDELMHMVQGKTDSDTTI